MTLRLIDLFSGAGGMTLGFVDPRFCGGFEPVLSIDNDRAAVRTHELNFKGRAVCANIEEWLENETVPQADVVIGGPPCQDLASSTRRETEINVERFGSHFWKLLIVPTRARSLWRMWRSCIARLSGVRSKRKHTFMASRPKP